MKALRGFVPLLSGWINGAACSMALMHGLAVGFNAWGCSGRACLVVSKPVRVYDHLSVSRYGPVISTSSL